MSYLGIFIVCYAFKLENAIEAAKNSEKKRLQFNTRLLQSSGLWPPLRGADWTFYWITAFAWTLIGAFWREEEGVNEKPQPGGGAPEELPRPRPRGYSLSSEEKKEDQTGALAV